MTGALPPLVAPGPELTAAERERYSRHVLLDGVGELGQRRLRAARVLLVGAGGLGSPVLQYLAAAGVGELTVVDDDRVDSGNLQRQVIHSESDVGRPKVESARDRVAELAGGLVRVRPVFGRVDETNARELVAGHDLVVDGSDNFATRYLVSDACEIAGVPLVWGTLDRMRGQLAVFWSRPPVDSGLPAVTLRDLFPAPPPPGTVPTCGEAGVLGALCGTVGSMLALEAVKLICGLGRPLLGRLLLVDALAAQTTVVALTPDPGREPVTGLVPVAPTCATGPGPDVPVVTPERLAAELAGPRPPLLLDVREADEREASRIDPAVWVPLGRVAEDVADPTGVVRRALAGHPGEVVVYCRGGARSATAVRMLRAAGIDGALSLDGGITAWVDGGHG